MEQQYGHTYNHMLNRRKTVGSLFQLIFNFKIKLAIAIFQAPLWGSELLGLILRLTQLIAVV